MGLVLSLVLNLPLKARIEACVGGCDRGAISIASSTRDAVQYPKMEVFVLGGAQNCASERKLVVKVQ